MLHLQYVVQVLFMVIIIVAIFFLYLLLGNLLTSYIV